MPGTIQVSVLEAVGLPPSFAGGRDLVTRVSIGAREQYTSAAPGSATMDPWDADFSFPVQNLQDDLVVAIMDNATKQILAKADVSTTKILEMGFRDEMFELQGPYGESGTIHLKLSFVLSEEELRKIVQMRQRHVVNTVVGDATGGAEKDAMAVGGVKRDQTVSVDAQSAPSSEDESKAQNLAKPMQVPDATDVSRLTSQAPSPASADDLTNESLAPSESAQESDVIKATAAAPLSAVLAVAEEMYSSASETSEAAKNLQLPHINDEVKSPGTNGSKLGVVNLAAVQEMKSSFAPDGESPTQRLEDAEYFEKGAVQSTDDSKQDLSFERSMDDLTPTASTATSDAATKDTETDEAEDKLRSHVHLGSLTKQILGGVAVVVGLFLLWPRHHTSDRKQLGFIQRLFKSKSSKKQSRFVSDQEDINSPSEFFRRDAEGRWNSKAQEVEENPGFTYAPNRFRIIE